MEKQERVPISMSTVVDVVILNTVNRMTATRAAEHRMLIHTAARMTVEPVSDDVAARTMGYSGGCATALFSVKNANPLLEMYRASLTYSVESGESPGPYRDVDCIVR